jgi:TonB family protein
MMVSCSARVMRELSFSGNVTSATMAKSTGNALLDKITTDTFGRWRFKSGTISQVQVPITYR